MLEKIHDLYSKNQDKILSTIGIILIATASFGAGRLSVQLSQKSQITIEDPKDDFFAKDVQKISQDLEKISTEKETNNINEVNPETKTQGKYVGSKNSDKYHLPDCPGALKITEENKIWFNSKEEAEARGYTPAKNCKGLQD